MNFSIKRPNVLLVASSTQHVTHSSFAGRGQTSDTNATRVEAHAGRRRRTQKPLPAVCPPLLLQVAMSLQARLGGEGAGRVPELLLLLWAPQVLLVFLGAAEDTETLQAPTADEPSSSWLTELKL